MIGRKGENAGRYGTEFSFGKSGLEMDLGVDQKVGVKKAGYALSG